MSGLSKKLFLINPIEKAKDFVRSTSFVQLKSISIKLAIVVVIITRDMLGTKKFKWKSNW